MSAERVRRRAETDAARRALAALTPREREVAELLVRGLRNRDIGERLGVAEKTVKVHRARVLEKTGAGSVATLVRLVALAGEP
ncbi:MAG: LuxR C-terminal-related transcriptional regulator [Anaeromyxobacter sp.]